MSEALQALVQNTPGALFFGENIQKTSASIRANMIAELRFLEFLRDDGIRPFSMRDWVKSERPGFVFLTGDAEHSAATRNVISTVIEVAANALMTGPERRDPSLWFFLDEVPSLNRLPFLPTKLAEIRQFGGAFVLGYQVYSQLEDLYGDKAAQSIAGTLNNRVVFNTPDARTARLFSDSLGLTDIIEHRETISFGADVTRDGNTLNAQRVERPIVTASEIQSLPQFKAYIRFGYDAPTALVQFPPITSKDIAPAIQKYEGKGFVVGSMDAPLVEDPGKVEGLGTTDPSASEQAKQPAADLPFLMRAPRQQLEEFDAWFARKTAPEIDPISFDLKSKAKEADKPLAWEDYCRARMRGVEDPDLRLADFSRELMSNRPGKIKTALPEVTSYDLVVRLAFADLDDETATVHVMAPTESAPREGTSAGQCRPGESPAPSQSPRLVIPEKRADRSKLLGGFLEGGL